MFRIDAINIVLKMLNKGPPNARNFPSRATNALRVKQVKITQVYIKAETTIEGSNSQTRSINGPADNPT